MENPILGMKGDSKAEDLHLQKPVKKPKKSKPKKKARQSESRQAIFIDEPLFGKIPEPLLRDIKVSPQARFIYAVYHLHAHQKHICVGSYSFPSQERIASEYVGVSPRYLRKLIAELKSKGWITTIKLGLGRPNIIVLHKVKNEKIDDEARALYKKIVKTKMRSYVREEL